jgi:hypothetical protein
MPLLCPIGVSLTILIHHEGTKNTKEKQEFSKFVLIAPKPQQSLNTFSGFS